MYGYRRRPTADILVHLYVCASLHWGSSVRLRAFTSRRRGTTKSAGVYVTPPTPVRAPCRYVFMRFSDCKYESASFLHLFLSTLFIGNYPACQLISNIPSPPHLRFIPISQTLSLLMIRALQNRILCPCNIIVEASLLVSSFPASNCHLHNVVHPRSFCFLQQSNTTGTQSFARKLIAKAHASFPSCMNILLKSLVSSLCQQFRGRLYFYSSSSEAVNAVSSLGTVRCFTIC